MPIAFSTKGSTLLALKSVIKSAQIAPLVLITVKDWRDNKKACITAIVDSLGSDPLIVRSSSRSEDTGRYSNAGKFVSLLDVSFEELPSSIDRVIESYGETAKEDQVLIQPMLSDILISGVVFSHDPNTCSPYRVVNWSEGEDTATVTSGIGGRVWQQAALSPEPPPPFLSPVITLLDELLELFDQSPIDCEFAVTQGLEGNAEREIVWLLQARPLILSKEPECPSAQAKRLQVIETKLQRDMQAHPFLMGSKTLYGVMPDWNPAEIIGIRPKPLSLSLYRELVTDSIWAYQRHNYGYRNLRSFPLMPHFYGLPYIDVRVSLNSFVPNDLEDELANRLVDYYMHRLLEEPELHDKIEFDVIFSCYTLDLPNQLERLRSIGFSKSDCDLLTLSLRKLTNRILHKTEGLWLVDAAKLNILNSRREILLKSNTDPLAKIYWLLEDAKRYGTLPFAGLARAGFIAIQLLKSLVKIGIFSTSDYEAFLANVSTVTGQLTHDRSALNKQSFLATYGHLRPGTYNIESPRYDESPDEYFDWDDQPVPREKEKPFSLTSTQMSEISERLLAHDIESGASELINFMKEAVELREMAKFHFTRNLSDALSLIKKVGQQHNLCKEDLAYCDIGCFKQLHIAAGNAELLLRNSIEKGRELYDQTLRTSLPPLISKPRDVWAFEWPKALPTFVSHKQVTASVAKPNLSVDLGGKIVCIPNADPGFDWIFAHPIAGLVTAWGGPNSHMAIRAGELELPAVIGTGEVLYRRLSAANQLHIDCSDQRVEVLI